MLRLVDARPFRQSVYNFQEQLPEQVNLQKVLARSTANIDIALEGQQNVVYFTHDYTSMASDKNQHLIAVAQLTRKHGNQNVVAVCPFEHDLAYSEDETSYIQRVEEAENRAMQINPNMTILKPSLAFGE